MLNRPRPFLMQALGGFIALVIMVPIAFYVVNSVFLGNTTPAAAPRYSVPSASGAASNSSGSSTSGSSSASAKTITIKMQPGKATAGFVFAPANITVDLGTTIKWVDVNSVPHNIVGSGSATALINRSAVNTDPYSVTFSKAGTYHYVCQVHPGMVGIITVKAGGSAASSSSSSSSAPSANSTTSIVKMQPGKATAGYVFAPAVLKIPLGTTVKWVDVNSVPHNIVGQGTAMATINRAAVNTDSYSVKFTKAGPYHYVCQVHPGMVGTIIVT